MLHKKYYLLFLSIFVQLFPMEQPAMSSSPVVGLPLEIWQKIVCSDFDYEASIKCLASTCRLLNGNLMTNMFIKDDTGNHIRDEWGNRILSPHIVHTMYKDDFYLCRLALSSCAKCYLKTQSELYENYFKQFYVFHADERNAGVKGVLDIKEMPNLEDCITVYGGNCYRKGQFPRNHGCHKSPSTSAHKSFNLLVKMSELIIDEDINAVNTIFLDDGISKEGESPKKSFTQFEEIAKELFFLDDCYIKKLFKDNGFYMMPLLVSNNGIDLEKVRKNIAVRIFASAIRYKKTIRKHGKGNLIDTICEDIESNNRGLFFLIWMHNLEYYWGENIKHENDFIKKFIETKKIKMNWHDAQEAQEECALDYVFSRAKRFCYPQLIIEQLSNLGCDMDAVSVDGKNLLQTEGEKYYTSLSSCLQKDCLRARSALALLLEKKIRELIKLKKNIDLVIDNYGNTVLHYAVMFIDTRLMWCALEQGVNVNVQNKDGMTPFFLLCLTFYTLSKTEKWDFTRVSFDAYAIDHLLNYGADVNKVDNKNQLPWHIMFDALRGFRSKMTCPGERVQFSDSCALIVKKFLKGGANINTHTSDGKFAYHGLDINAEIENYLYDEKEMRSFKKLAYYGLGALCVYGVFKYFHDK